MTNNSIDPSAYIDPRVKIGSFNRIGKNVQIRITDSSSSAVVTIGDNNIINDNTRILVGSANVSIGDWNVFHNDMLIMGGLGLDVGHNGWFGQNTILDGSGKLVIGNGVRIGMYSQVWTHVASGELIEGCTLFGFRPTMVEDDVWLVGSCMVSSGITIGRRSIVLSQSNITKDTKPNGVYAGSPAVEKNLTFYKEITMDQKCELIDQWTDAFVMSSIPKYAKTKIGTSVVITHSSNGEKIEIGPSRNSDAATFFDLKNKTFNKTNSEVEREFYKFVYGHKARFVPIR